MKEFDIFKNPNEEEYKEITEAVKLNDNYCPCLTKKEEDTKCMCKAFRDSEDVDFCHCGRFYKVKSYEALALIGDTSEDEDMLNFGNWYERLTFQDFIVFGIPVNLYDLYHDSERRKNLYKSVIAKADAIVVLGHCQELTSLVQELIEWAGAIGKKVLTREDLIK